jgi:hypothetical protein
VYRLKLKKWVKYSLLVVVLAAVGAGGYIYLASDGAKVKNEIKKVEKVVKEATEPQLPVEEEKPEPKSPVTKENYEKIKVGKGIKATGGSKLNEVVELFGNPTGVAEKQSNDGTRIKVYEWKNVNVSVSVTFVNDLVFDKSWIEVDK